jgi:signal transduction histidine kinase
MLFGGFAGATAFFPEKVVDRGYVPPTVLTRLRLLDSTFDSDRGAATAVPIGDTGEVTLRPSQSKFSIEFAALSFLSPGTNRFRYRLEGLQEEWAVASEGQRAATYMALPAGTYAFQVQAATRHGAWSDPPATLRIVMLPPWWASRPFLALTGLAMVALLIEAYRFRVRQLTHAYNLRLEERWGERTRIARELHDTLLQSFQGLMFRLQAARDLLPTQAEKAVPVLDLALTQGEAAIDEARGAVTDLRSSENVDQNVETGLSAIAAAAARLSTTGSEPPWSLVTTGTPRAIHRTVLYEVYQVVREALSNAYRHARADSITVSVRYGIDTFDVTVADDGVGCDEARLMVARRQKRWGVQGMKERAERLGGVLVLHSRPSEGTEVTLSLPAVAAYRVWGLTDRLGALLSWRAGRRSLRRG